MRETRILDRNRNMICEGNILERVSHCDMLVVWDEKQQIFMGELIWPEGYPKYDYRYTFPLDDIAPYSKIKEV